MNESIQEANELLKTALDIGETMLTCGGEVSRVEDTITRICKSYGATRVNPFVITSSIVVTVEFHGGMTVTQTRRVNASATDFTLLEELNDLSRYICGNKPEILKLNELFEQRIRECEKKSRSKKKLLGFMLASASFAVFFGGNAIDSVIAAGIAVLIWLLEAYFRKIIQNQLLYQLFAAFVMGVSAMAFSYSGLPVHVDKIMIGDIMLLIPGLAMTNAVRDVFSGDTISGMLRLCESLLMAAMIAAGTVSAVLLMGGRG